MLRINGKTVNGNSFAYDGCHKIYICESGADVVKMVRYGYRILPLKELDDVWGKSCPLRFIDNAKLDKMYVPQCCDATFEWKDYEEEENVQKL